MGATRILLTEKSEAYIAAALAEGRFSTASEMVLEALSLLEQRDLEAKSRPDRLRAAAQQGLDELDRGEGETFSSIDEVEAFIQRTGEEVRTAHRRA